MTVLQLEGAHTALLVYHMTDIRTRPDNPGYEPWIVESLPALQRLIAGCRKAGVLLIYTIPDWDVAAGSGIIPELAPLPSEPLYQHGRGGGAFAIPQLAPLLRESGRTSLLISGNAVDRGLNDTARQAGPLGYRPIMVRGACFTQDILDSPLGSVEKHEIERVHLAALLRHGISVMTIDEVLAALA